MENKIKVYLLSLGCAKNLVDSQVMEGALLGGGFALTDDPASAEVILVNTCGFIEAAKQEGIASLLELAEYKQSGCCRLLIAVGCMAEKYGGELLAAMPELDAVSGSQGYADIGALISAKLDLELPLPAPPANEFLLRQLAPGSASAYLKIAEGCDNCCSFCLIPQLRGPYRSRRQEDILEEARLLAAGGVRELVLIAQDTTRYGEDLYGANRLPQLLTELAALPFAMIRLLYAYPDRISDQLVAVMAAHGNICRYLDLPIQHGSDRILSAMGRSHGSAEIRDAVARLRAAMPDIALRTTVMVGFPGETEEDFAVLMDFLTELRFQWLGAFPYYQEEDTPAAALPQQVAAEVKTQRLDAVMRQAAEITEQSLSRWLGRSLPVLAEAEDEEAGWYLGRSQYQAPEVDGVIRIYSPEPLTVGQIYQVRLTGQDIYDLTGELA